MEALPRKLPHSCLTNLLQISEDFRNPIQALPGGLMQSGFPTPQRALIDTHSLSHFPLREAKHLPPCCKAFREGASGLQRIVAQESDDGRNEAGFWLGFVAFPVGNGQRMNANLVGHPPLEEIEVEPPGPEMVA